MDTLRFAAPPLILVVADVPMRLGTLADILPLCGYRVRIADDRIQALRAARSESPDLILLGTDMADDTVYDICEQLKHDLAIRDLPVIVFSFDNSPAAKVRALAAGAVDCITEPFDTDEVLARIRTHLALHHKIVRRGIIVDSLMAVQRTVYAHQDLCDTLTLIAVETKELLNPDALVIGNVDAPTQTLSVMTELDLSGSAGVATALAMGYKALVQAMQAQQPILYTDETDAGQRDGAESSSLCAFQAVLAAPMVVQGKPCFGGVLLYFADAPMLVEEEKELAMLLAAQAGMAIEFDQFKAAAEKDAITHERKRIARDLHDSVTQSLTTVSIIAESLPAVWQRHHEEALRSLGTLALLARNALTEMRTLLAELRPGEADDRPLGELLRELPATLSLDSTLVVTTTVVGDEPLPGNVRTALYRIAQEALNNVRKHAKASRAWIHLHFRPDGTLMLRIGDNGCGIEPQGLHRRKLGMGIMRERAHEIGAVLTIENQPGQGTQVVVIWQDAKLEQSDAGRS